MPVLVSHLWGACCPHAAPLPACPPCFLTRGVPAVLMQHRGQDSAGMVTTNHEKFWEHKWNGLVKDVFNNQALLDKLEGGPELFGQVCFAKSHSCDGR